jgi:hypothetical protein
MASRMRRARRWTDRTEDAASWVLFAAGFLLVVFACALGTGTYDRMAQEGRDAALERSATSATLVESTPDIASAYGGRPLVDVRATWHDRAGAEHTGLVTAPQGMAEGSTVPIWIDRTGAPVAKPTSAADAAVIGAIVAGLVVLAAATVLGLLWAALHRVLMAYNYAAWEQEWQAVAPLWSRDDGRRG